MHTGLGMGKRDCDRRGPTIPSLLLVLALPLGTTGCAAHLAAATWGLAALALLLAGWVVRLRRQARRDRAERERRAETTRGLTAAIRAAEGKPWSGELLAALEDRFRNDEEALLRIHASRAHHVPRRPRVNGA